MGVPAQISLSGLLPSVTPHSCEVAVVFSPWTFTNAEVEMLCDSKWNNFDVTRNVIKATAVF